MDCHADTLDSTRFVVLGCGGLGAPVIVALVGAGAQHFVLIDDDQVEVHNLHRQVIYSNADRGRSKAHVAREWILARRPHASVELQTERITDVEDQLILDGASAEVVIECSDQPDLKFQVSAYCAQHRVVAVIGGAQGWTGHVFGQIPGQACLRCLFEAPPPAELSPSCAIAGVFSTTTGLIGHFMAGAALELAIAQPSTSFFFNCDARDLAPRRLAVGRRQTCECANTHPLPRRSDANPAALSAAASNSSPS